MLKQVSIALLGLASLGFGTYYISSLYFTHHKTVSSIPAVTNTIPNSLPNSITYPDIDVQNEQEEKQSKIRMSQQKARHQAYLTLLSSITGKEIGSFSTSLQGHNAKGRVINIELACQKIDGLLLMPGDLFSFNTVLGDSNDPKGGWQEATVIVGKQFEQGYGGGICQVSSTLYNAALAAKLEIQERYTHSLPVGYVPSGHDATVSYPELDFKFSNSLDSPVRIRTQISGDLVVCKIYQLPAEPQ